MPPLFVIGDRLGAVAWAELPGTFREAINDALTRGGAVEVSSRRVLTLADAYVCAKIFGRGGAAALLEEITTDDVRGSKLKGCINYHVRNLEKNVGIFFCKVDQASLVAVLQSPLHGERPTLLKLKKGEPLPLIRPPLPP